MSVSLGAVRQSREEAKKRKYNLVNRIFLAVCGVLILGGIVCLASFYVLTPESSPAGTSVPRGWGRQFLLNANIFKTVGGVAMILAGCIAINAGRKCYRSFFFVGIGILTIWPWLAILIGIVSDSRYRASVGMPVFLLGSLCTALYLGFAIYRNSVLPRKQRDELEY